MSAVPALVILAAGESARLSRCKALVPITPRNPLELLVQAGACCAGAPPLVVTGADHREIAAAAPPGVELLHNPAWREGRTGGVRLAALARPELDLCLAPVDVPLVPSEVFEALLARWLQAGSPARGWLEPCRVPGPGRPPAGGHPVLVGRSLLGELCRISPAAPLRVLRERAEPRIRLEVESPAVLDDLDAPADLERLRARFRGEAQG